MKGGDDGCVCVLWGLELLRMSQVLRVLGDCVSAGRSNMMELREERQRKKRAKHG